MTREEAKEILLQSKMQCDYPHGAYGVAVDMAIQALEQEPKTDGDCISRAEAKQFLYERIDRLNDDELYDIFSRIIDDMYNELQPRPKYKKCKKEQEPKTVVAKNTTAEPIGNSDKLDCIRREDAIKSLMQYVRGEKTIGQCIEECPSVWQEPTKTGYCKDCKYFEYDSIAKVDGIPLIVAHEICSKWSNGCKTKEDGYCFLFEQKMESEE